LLVEEGNGFSAKIKLSKITASNLSIIASLVARPAKSPAPLHEISPLFAPIPSFFDFPVS